MRKIISLLSVTGLLLALSAGQAKATCGTFTNQQIPGITGYTFSGQFCYSSTYDYFSYTGTVTKGGQTYPIVASANVTETKNTVTVSGSITVNGKSTTFTKTVSTQYGSLSGLIAWAEKLAEQLP